ncbi:ATP-binding protein [Rubrivirga sp. S365]|uniref:AlbA family DNA-binding domain-containing protein n=1 Tax=Rubrivirga sp. S365 TaxID=3076080 RepID=UPI0028C9D09F|nr:ATP-binding protein [Rubrivirga sp. S365]MDT7858186.1 ATP-binding protein [Rubrivirga sp. S365]
MVPTKNIHESFSRFFEEPTRETLRDLLRTNFGETDQLDFKASWPDFPKVARHVLAIANSGGGAIVFGVEEAENSLDPKGLSDFRDKAEVAQGLKKYLPNDLRHETLDFAYEASEYPALTGKSFQVIVVEHDDTSIPYLCLREGSDVKDNVVYVRRGTESAAANHDELQRIIDRRFRVMTEERQNSLEEDLSQLSTLRLELFKSQHVLAFAMHGHNDFLKNCIAQKEEVILRKLQA